MLSVYVFFFKQKTAYDMRISDWSSDVCSSDLRSKHAISNRHHQSGLPDGHAMRTNEESRQPCAHAIDAGGDQHDRADAVEQAGAGGQQAVASDEAEASGFIHRRHFIAVAPLWVADQNGRAAGREQVCQYVEILE